MSHAETGARQEGNAPRHPATSFPAPDGSPGSAARWHAAAVLLLFGLVAHAWSLKVGSDFEVFRLAGWRTWHGVLPYQHSDGLMPFKYGPPMALLLVPLPWLPRHIGYLGWLVLSALALLPSSPSTGTRCIAPLARGTSPRPVRRRRPRSPRP